MGNQGGKLSAEGKDAMLSLDAAEAEALEANYKEIVTSSKALSPEVLAQRLKVSKKLGTSLFMALRASQKGKDRSLDASKPLKFDELVIGITKCCSSEQFDKRAFWISVMLPDGSTGMSRADLSNFFNEMIGMSLPSNMSQADKKSLLERLVKESVDQAFDGVSGSTMDEDRVTTWLRNEKATEDFFSKLMSSNFLRRGGGGTSSGQTRQLPRLARPSRLLREEHLWTLGGHIPPQHQDKPWKLLFSSNKHGQSFSRFLKCIFKGPTVLVLKDKGGHIFGGYAPVSWHRWNKFYGDRQTFLFSIYPKTKVYRSSGVNENFMWLSTTLTSCTNGLGMGGQKDYWGIYVDTGLENGVCRAPCSTFTEMPCLSSEAKFQIEECEVWGCIPGYQADDTELAAAGVKRKPVKNFDQWENRGKTALDDQEAKAILEAAGVQNHSDDIRKADAQAERERKAKLVAEGKASPEDYDDESEEDDFEYDDGF